jgi:very-short-patch-repair endonuclease
MAQVFNKKPFTELRKDLRRIPPKPEQLIWNRIRNRQLGNCKFRRQVGIGRYVVDFYCPQKKLVIELDGESHYVGDAPMQDKIR